jgi:lipoprotein
MKKFLIISFVCSLFSCQNTCKEIIENSKTETEAVAVAVGQIPENIITKKKPNTDEVIDIRI